MAVYLTTLRGTLAAATINEIFSHSLGIESNAEPSVIAQAIHDSWRSVWNTPATGFIEEYTTHVVYVEATVAQVLDPLVPNLAAATHSLFSPPLTGAETVPTMPPQNAIAISLRAGVRPNGSPLRGRFYMPAPKADRLSPDGLLLPSAAGVFAENIYTHLNTLKAAGHTPVVWSRTVEDLVNPITEIRVGSRVDTIRSRRNSAAESYTVRSPI